ncbi:TetR family transcriptional regulator C-terminal domain-containing protein [Aminobacter sp. P9b]|uniref:TetR family transcriptional regulator C-terminal domain-containing protein n=1 Tax=Aminobacter TaxID=31988 RepID=UPI0024CDA492|nr:TetR family transcriptional regulator C-terminal domain-containing protein [Aminobacter niigataensis]CAI2933127.1 Rut operon repressor [Aminobacter niigataensis]
MKTADAPRTPYSAAKRKQVLDAIYDAAIVEFSLHGPKGASTQGIAERAGISKQHLHYYIDSKEALYAEVMRRAITRWGKGITLAGKHADPVEAISALIRSKLDFALDFPQESRLLTNDVLSGGTFMAPLWKQWTARRRKAALVVERWISTGLIQPLDPILFMFHLWALTQYYADYESQVRAIMGVKDGQPLDRERIVAEVTTFVLRGCGLDPASVKSEV